MATPAVRPGTGSPRWHLRSVLITCAPQPPQPVPASARVTNAMTREECPMSMRLAAAVAALIALPGAAGAQVLMEPNVSAKMALAIAETAIAECGSRVSVAVVDRAGRLRVFVQGDGAAPHNLELARRKAYTARTFGRTSLE